MGHIRLGRLAKSLSWQRLVAVLDLPDLDVASVAAVTADGAQHRLHGLRTDPVMGYSCWLLCRLATAARSDAFVEQSRRLGLEIRPGDSALSLVAKLNALVRTEVERTAGSGPFAEIASLALRRTLLETLGVAQGHLFGRTIDDLQTAIRAGTTNRAFGDLAVRFFGDVLGRTLRFYVDKELPFHIGANSGFADIATSDRFVQDLDRYARQSARIVDRYATEWLSKYAYQEQGAITREQAQGFVALAMTKLDAELRLEPVA
jgi:hypothetical protein